MDDPAGYGRVIRDPDGRFAAIVEDADADETQRAIREVYPSYGCFTARHLFRALESIEPDTANGEYRITDVPVLLGGEGRAIELVDGFPEEEVLSINTPEQLRAVEAIMSARLGGVR